MSSPTSQGYTYGFNRVSMEKSEAEDTTDPSVVDSENDGLLQRNSTSKRTHARKGIRHYLDDPGVTFIAGGIMFSILIILGIITLAATQTRSFITIQGHSESAPIQRLSHAARDNSKDLRNEKGLRITKDGKINELPH